MDWEYRNVMTVAVEKKVIIPGDPEREMQGQRMKEGITLIEPVAKDLEQLAEKFRIVFC